MPLIVIRLHPEKPIVKVAAGQTPGTAFAEYLKGLTIEVSDRSFADPDGRDPAHLLGKAFYAAADPKSTIIQHIAPPPPPPAPPPPPPPPLVPAATAAIEIPAPTNEYLGRDVSFTVARTIAGDTTPIVVKELNFNIALDPVSLPVAPLGILPPDPLAYAALTPVAGYLPMPPPLSSLPPGTTFLDVPADGSPSPFAAVLKAMQAVVAQDPGPGSPPDLAALTPIQAQHIAREIEFNRVLEPLPEPSAELSDLYSGVNEDARHRFEADLTTYYAVHTAKADVLAKYVFGVSAALACQRLSQNQAKVALTVPVFPGLAPFPTATVVVSQ